MKHFWFRLGRFKLLVTMPHNWAYGHLALEMLISLGMARTQNAAVYFIERRKAVNRALFLLKSDAVKILPRSRWLAWLIRTLWSVRQGLAGSSEKALLSSGPPSLNADSGVNAAKTDETTDSYFRRRLICEPVPVRLSDRDEVRALRQAEAFGITASTRLVTLHVRESGFHSKPDKPELVSMSTRNAKIETYHRAVDFLVHEGFRVVRIGDPTMRPLQRYGVVDLATSKQRTELLELYCLLKSEFLLGCESGLLGVSYLVNTPFLNVNATDPVSSYPVRSDGLYILKRVMERHGKRVLSLSEMLDEDYLFNLRNVERYEYLDNTSDEILDATQEMMRWLHSPREPNADQKEYKKRLELVVEDLRDRWDYVRKWGSDAGFLGDGWICGGFAERTLHSSKEARFALQDSGEHRA
jgi:putative glycosyltransferase (TIGR04372 family)